MTMLKRWNFAFGLGFGASGIGVAALAARLLHIKVWRPFGHGTVSMVANTAVCLSLLGLSLALESRPEQPVRRRRAAAAMQWSVIVIAGLTLIEYGFGIDLGIDQALLRSPIDAIGLAAPGRMAVNTGLALLLSAWALRVSQTKVPLSHGLGVGSLFIASLSLVGYFYGIEAWSGYAVYARMAPSTAVALVLIAAGILSLHQDRGVFEAVMRDTPGGTVLRRLLPFAIVLPPAIVYLDVLCERRCSFDPTLSASLAALTAVFAVVVLVWLSSLAVDARDARLQESGKILKEVISFDRALLATIPVGIDIVGEDGRILFMNEAMKNLVGPGAIGQRCWTIYKDDKMQCGECPLLSLLPIGVTEKIESRGVLHGKTFEISHTGMIYQGRRALLEVFYDVTERKRAEDQLQVSVDLQTGLNAILRNSPLDEMLNDKLERHLAVLLATPWLSVEPMGAVFLTGPGGEALSLAASKGLSPQLRERCAKIPVGRCLCGSAARGLVVASSCLSSEHEISRAGMEDHGHYISPIIANGKVLGVLNLYLRAGRALSDKQKAFVESVASVMANDILRARVEAQLRQSQKMETVGLLAGGVAHDFNNLLTAISGYANLLKEQLAADAGKSSDLDQILLAGDRAKALTQQLLAFSRRQVVNPVVVDLNAGVSRAAGMIRRIIGERVRVEVLADEKPCPARIDPGQLDQVLVNLSVNARDAMPEGGILTIETKTTSMPEDWRARHPGLREGPLVRLSVSDTGTGMEPGVMSRLFEPFFTTKPVGQGTGLGLSVVRGIVSQNGGAIEVESVVGRGTVFLVYLPLSAEAAPAAASAAAPAAGGREVILLVEDEEPLRALMARVLRARGYTVLTTAHGEEALRTLEAHAGPVDLMLTDMVMPGLSGRELSRRAAALRPGLRTLFMSGYTDDAIARQGGFEPGLQFIAKPFAPAALAAKVRAALDAPVRVS